MVPLVEAAVGIATWEGPEPPSVRALLLSAQEALSAARRPGIGPRVRVVAAPAAYDQSPSLPELEIPEETTEELEEVAEAAEASDEPDVPEEAQEADTAETEGMTEGPEEEPVTMAPGRKAPPA